MLSRSRGECAVSYKHVRVTAPMTMDTPLKRLKRAKLLDCKVRPLRIHVSPLPRLEWSSTYDIMNSLTTTGRTSTCPSMLQLDAVTQPRTQDILTRTRYRASIFCLFFARGLCPKGHRCEYLHKLQTSHDLFNPNIDCFGRDKHSDYRDDMGGVGSFMRQNRTLYVRRIHVRDDMEEIVARPFAE